MKAWYQVSQT